KVRQARSVVEVAERHARVLWALQDCLLELSRRIPLVILVDDVHAIDAESLSLLASLAHELRDNALLLALAVKPGETADEHVMAKLMGACTRAQLAPLS